MIQEGLLWFDDTATRPTAEKIRNAVARYRQKYHHDPDVCYIHPALSGELAVVDNVKVLASKIVLPNHFWLGVLETAQPRAARVTAS